MPHVLDQGVYGPSVTRKGVGMDWLAWSKDLSEAKRNLLARFAPDTYPPGPGPWPARYVVASIQPSGSLFTAKSQLFAFKLTDGTTRPAWVTHFLYDFPPHFPVSKTLQLEAGRLWIGPNEVGSRAARHPLPQLDEKKDVGNHTHNMRPWEELPEPLVEAVLAHLAAGPHHRICLTTESLEHVPRCMLTLVRAAEQRRHPALKVASLSTLEWDPIRTPFAVTGAPPQTRQRLQADQRFGVVDLDKGELWVGKQRVALSATSPASEPIESGERGAMEASSPDRRASSAPDQVEDRPRREGDDREVAEPEEKRASWHPVWNLRNALSQIPLPLRPSRAPSTSAERSRAADPSTSMPATPAPLPTPTVAQLLGQIAAFAGASDEAQRVEAAIGRYLADTPMEERHAEIAKTIGALAELKDAGDQRAKARLIGMLLGREPKALLTGKSAQTIDRIFRDLESQDRAILLRAGLGRLDDETAQAPLTRRIADVFVGVLEKGRDAVAARTPEANNLRLALDAIGQSAVDDAGLKLRAMRLLDWALLHPGGDAPLRALARTVPREVEELRGELKRSPSPEEALARLDKDFSLAQGLATQLKVETLLLLLAASLEAPCAKVFAALLPYAQQVPGLHDTTRAIATGPLQLGTWDRLLAEADIAELRALYEERFPGELPRAAAG